MDEKQRELYYGLYRRMYAFGTLSLRQLKAIYTDNANNESKFAAAGDNAYESFKASQSALFEVIQKVENEMFWERQKRTDVTPSFIDLHGSKYHVRNVPICNFPYSNAREYPYKMDTSRTDLPLQNGYIAPQNPA